MFIIALGMLGLSTYYLYRAFEAYVGGEAEAVHYAVIGVVGLSVTFYMIFILARRPIVRFTIRPTMSTVECLKCGFKSIRRFAKGDYVFKKDGICRKCNEPLLITAIYSEEPKKR
jgi:hypothetical protein